MEEVKDKADFIKKLFRKLNLTDKNTQVILALENQFYENKNSTLNEDLISSVLYKFYESELLDEEFILKWYENKLQYFEDQTLFNKKYNDSFR